MTWRAKRHPDDELPPPPPLGATMAQWQGQEPPEPDPFAVPLEQEDPFAVPLEPPATAVVFVDTDPMAERLAPEWLVARPPQDVTTFTRNLQESLQRRVTQYAEELHARRPDGRLTEAALAVEVEGLTLAEQALRAVSRAFASAADLARDCLTELTLEVRGDEVERKGGSTSIRVGTAAGDVRVTVTQPTKVSVLPEVVSDVLARDAEHRENSLRYALTRLLSLMSPPAWKITALDAYRRELERAGLGELATALAAAYGRKPHGKMQTKVEEVQP